MRQASVLTLVLVACLGMVVHRASASPMGLTRIELNGANVSGSVSFEGNPWRGYFSSPVGGRVTISPYITGDNDDKVVRVCALALCETPAVHGVSERTYGGGGGGASFAAVHRTGLPAIIQHPRLASQCHWHRSGLL